MGGLLSLVLKCVSYSWPLLSVDVHVPQMEKLIRCAVEHLCWGGRGGGSSLLDGFWFLLLL